MQASYKIVSQGCQEGTDPHQVAQRVAALFRCQPGDVEGLLRTRKSTVKRKLDLQRADRYRRALDGCGLMVSIEEEAPPRAKAVSPAAPAPARRREQVEPAPASVAVAVEEQVRVQLLAQQALNDAQAAVGNVVPARVANPLDNPSVEALMFQMRCDADDERARNKLVYKRVMTGISVFCVLMLVWMAA